MDTNQGHTTVLELRTAGSDPVVALLYTRQPWFSADLDLRLPTSAGLDLGTASNSLLSA